MNPTTMPEIVTAQADRKRAHVFKFPVGARAIGGNLAKVKVLNEIADRLERGERPRVLDIGCVGLRPFEFWAPLFGKFDFELTGVDVAGLDRAEQALRENGWTEKVTLRQASGYTLSDVFPADSFDIVVATQVLEHVPKIDRFMSQVSHVLRPGGDAYLTLDSAHFIARYSPRAPVRLVKNVAKKLLSLAGQERHYDLPWYDKEVRHSARAAGLTEIRTEYYNLFALKRMHNHVVAEPEKNEVLARWYELESALNSNGTAAQCPQHFLDLYVHLRKDAGLAVATPLQ